MRAHSRIKRQGLLGELPEDVLTNRVRVTLYGRRAALVEGQCGVMRMSDQCIMLRSESGLIRFCGAGLSLKELSLDAAIIMGEGIESVSYGNG